MNIKDYKEKFGKKFLYEIEELSKYEVEKIPKSDKKEQLDYLVSKGYFVREGKYYRKVYIDVSDQDISICAQIKMIDMLGHLNEQVEELRIEQKIMGIRISRIQMTVSILFITILGVIFISIFN